jgi:predicted nucleotidyltransferase
MDLPISKISQILKKYPIEQAYLFGSHVHGTVTPLSDIDIAVLYLPNADTDKTETALYADLSNMLKTDNIDLVNLDRATPLLAHRAVLLGKPLLQHDPHHAAMFQTKILHAYEDTRHLRALKSALVV